MMPMGSDLYCTNQVERCDPNNQDDAVDYPSVNDCRNTYRTYSSLAVFR